MSERVQHTNQVRDTGGNTTTATRIVETDHVDVYGDTSLDGQSTASRVVWYIAGILLVLLGFRFALALLGANPANGFANFIYTTSHPFVSPFFSLFNYDLRYGVSRFETFTLVAMAVYALIAFGISRLLTINKPSHTHTASHA